MSLINQNSIPTFDDLGIKIIKLTKATYNNAMNLPRIGVTLSIQTTTANNPITINRYNQVIVTAIDDTDETITYSGINETNCTYRISLNHDARFYRVVYTGEDIDNLNAKYGDYDNWVKCIVDFVGVRNGTNETQYLNIYDECVIGWSYNYMDQITKQCLFTSNHH